MISSTNYILDTDILQSAIRCIPDIDFKLPLNEPTDDFFYSPWKIKTEFKNTVWEDVLDSLPELHGEARLIKLDPGTCYYAHADIDDRWHLSLQAEQAFLIDIHNEKMHKIDVDGRWYNFEATNIHSAANFGNIPRVQLVVRKLLHKNKLHSPVYIKLTLKKFRHDYRYLFDHAISPWLNKANKNSWLTDFKMDNDSVTFLIEGNQIDNLSKIMPTDFELICQ